MNDPDESNVETAVPVTFAVKIVRSRASHRTRAHWGGSTRSVGRPSVRVVARGPWRNRRRAEQHVGQVPFLKSGKLDARAEQFLFGRIRAYLARNGWAAEDVHAMENDLRERLVARGICEPERPNTPPRPTETEVRRMVNRVIEQTGREQLGPEATAQIEEERMG